MDGGYSRSTYDIQFESLLTEDGTGNGRQSTTKTMTDNRDTVIGVGCVGLAQLRGDLLADDGPIFPEPRMDPAAGADLVDLGWVVLIVGAEITLRHRCTEGEDNELFRVVQGQIAGRTSGAVKDIDDVGVIGADETTCAGLTGETMTSGIDVLIASREGSELREQIEVPQELLGDSYFR